MKKLMKYLKPYWYFALLAPLFMVGEVILDLVQPQLMKIIVDEGILQEALDAASKTTIVIKYGLIMLGCLAIGGLFGILSAACASAAANAFGNNLRKETFSKIVDLSFEQTDQFTTGSLITRITNDITQVQDFVSMALRMFVRTLVMFIGGIIFMYITNKTFALILTAVLPLQIIIIVFFLRKIIPFFAIAQQKIDKVNSVVQENVNGIRVVKAYIQEEKEGQRFHEANSELADVTLNVQKIMAFLNPIILLILNAVVIAIIYFSGLEISNNVELIIAGNAEVLTVGKVMSGLTYVTMVLMAVIQLAMFSQFITRASVSAKRINEVLASTPVVISPDIKKEPNHVLTGAVEYEKVDFSYPNLLGKLVLSDFSLKINHGESVAILGATGSGKTTIVNLIPRFYDASNGAVYVDGVNVKEYGLDTLRHKISFVMQKTELFSGTIKDNICWGKNDATDEEVVTVAKIAQAHEFIADFTEGYDTIIGEKGSSLSGGQKQRIAIARALLKKPQIMIFDDSTSALDLATEAQLYKALKETLVDTTLILIAQRVASAKNCDKIAIIDKGKLVACDTHEELIKSCMIYQDIYASQLKRGAIDE